jgi:hypothetical protein
MGRKVLALTRIERSGIKDDVLDTHGERNLAGDTNGYILAVEQSVTIETRSSFYHRRL